MASEDSHVSDQYLLLAADGELSARRTAEIRAHLAACWQCRTRMKEMENVIGDFMDCYRQLDAQLPPAVNSRALLKARLAEAARSSGRWLWLERVRYGFHKRPGLAYGGAVAVLVLLSLVGLSVRVVRVSRESRQGFFAGADLQLPDRRLTPGAVVQVSAGELCSAGDLDRHMVPAPLARRAFELYGIQRPQPRAYEADYLITPALGGAEDVRNLWPQPYAKGAWNSRHKDALEDQLQRLVCAQELPLEVAQHDISLDWIAAYKKYFETDVPIPEHLSFIKDHPWED